jgi:cytochrome c biogenesis protein CcdA
VLKSIVGEKTNMEITNEIAQIWLPLMAAALVQASFSLGVSMLTLLSGHLLSAPESARRLHRLSAAYILGSLITVAAGLIVTVYLLTQWPLAHYREFWSVLAGISVGVGLAVMLFYYRWNRSGTRLWLPRVAAKYLYERTRATRRTFEAFILGVGAIVAELIFIAAPLLIAGNLLAELHGLEQILAIGLYLIIAILPLLALFVSNLGRHKISAFQKWRENNKKFLQVAAGTLLIILGLYLFSYKVLGGNI